MKTKKCTKCSEFKALTDFGKDKKCKNGLKPKCKSCRKQEQKQYIKRNPDKKKSYDKQYRKDNKEKASEYQKNYRKKNKKRLNEQAKKWRLLNKDKISEKNTETYTRNCPRCNSILTYVSKSKRNRAIKRSTMCKSCTHYPNAPYIENEKWCNGCKINKPFDLFRKDKSTKDGLNNHCKDCEKEYNKEHSKCYRAKNKEIITIKKKQYYENNKEKISETGKKRYENNKEHIAQVNKEWVRKNPEKVAVSHSKWLQKNPENRRKHSRKCARKRRAQKLEVQENFTSAQEEITRKAFNNKCFNCGSIEKLCIDHHRPLSKGHALALDNAVVLCYICNSIKLAKDPEDFYGIEKCKQLDEKLKKLAQLHSKE